MLNNYYVLQALGREWRAYLVGAVMEDAWSHAPGELTVAVSKKGQFCMPTFVTHVPVVGAFRKPGFARPRRNAMPMFTPLRGQMLTDVRVAEGDRMFTFEATGGLRVLATLFGARANVFLLGRGGEVIEQFRKGALPEQCRAHVPQDFAEFNARWLANFGPAAKAIASVMIFFDHDLAQETLARAGLAPDAPASLNNRRLEQLYNVAMEIHNELLRPAEAHVYSEPDALSLIPLQARASQPVKSYSSVDEAVRIYAQRRLARLAFEAAWTPRNKALVQALGRVSRSLRRMRGVSPATERADAYERFGHLIMAAQEVPPGADRVQLPDLYSGGNLIDIPLDPALNRIQNAERYYKKARKTREAHRHRAALLAREEAKAAKLAGQLEALRKVKTLGELKSFEKVHGQPVKGTQAASTPFRRYQLAPGYELWVGRNAKESETLTLRYARPFDVWLHARGVRGAHAVLRLPGRQAEPSALLLEKAAAIAAWYSKARGSALAPVIVTPRKFVRKAKGAPLGEVIVSREDVLIVEPGLP